jgi:hypothetical protein
MKQQQQQQQQQRNGSQWVNASSFQGSGAAGARRWAQASRDSRQALPRETTKVF